MNNCVLITGALGGIGRGLVEKFSEDFTVIAIDRLSDPDVDSIVFELESLRHESSQQELKSLVQARLDDAGASLTAVINNAAVQLLGSVAETTLEDFERSLFVNLTAPFVISKLFADDLTAENGCIVNIGSIHANLTKPGFVSYATSKAALAGLTRAMAVDLNGTVRVNCIEPAAISTSMLEAGFKDNPDARDQLDAYHPSGRIGQVAEVANLAHALVSKKMGFMNGACVGLDGAIRARLHDPS